VLVALVVALTQGVVEAAPVEWRFAGTVTRIYNPGSGMACAAGDSTCSPLTELIPLGSQLLVSFPIDTSVSEASNCKGLFPGAVPAVRTEVGGTAYVATSVHTWFGAYGFANGCANELGGGGFEVVTLGYAYDGEPFPYSVGYVALYGSFGSGWLSGMYGGAASWPVSQQPLAMTYMSPVFSFVNESSQGSRYSYGQFYADLVSVPASVPAPSSAILLVLGVGFGLWRRRRC
jgi:hypothetical protein